MYWYFDKYNPSPQKKQPKINQGAMQEQLVIPSVIKILKKN